jgi:hypothetical protein
MAKMVRPIAIARATKLSAYVYGRETRADADTAHGAAHR